MRKIPNSMNVCRVSYRAETRCMNNITNTICFGFQENEGSRYRQGQGWRRRKEEEVKERFLFRFLRQKTEVKAPFPIRIRRLVSVLAKLFFRQYGIFPLF